MRSEQLEAKIFRKWITSELVTINKINWLLHSKTNYQTNNLQNRTDLHYKVVHFIKNRFPHISLTPGLGEYPTTSTIRNDAFNKGYTGGQPDITINTPNKSYSGFAIELKTPTVMANY